MLEDALQRTQAGLLIIDPLHSYLWAIERHRANDQRDGVCMITVRRAKCELGVLTTKDSVNSPWYWTLPQDPQRPQTASHLK